MHGFARVVFEPPCRREEWTSTETKRARKESNLCVTNGDGEHGRGRIAAAENLRRENTSPTPRKSWRRHRPPRQFTSSNLMWKRTSSWTWKKTRGRRVASREACVKWSSRAHERSSAWRAQSGGDHHARGGPSPWATARARHFAAREEGEARRPTVEGRHGARTAACRVLTVKQRRPIAST